MGEIFQKTSSSDMGPMANRCSEAPAAEEQQEAGVMPVLSPRTSTRCLLSVENSLEGIRETFVVRRLDAMVPLQLEEERPNLRQREAQRRRGAELQGGYRNHRERRLNQL